MKIKLTDKEVEMIVKVTPYFDLDKEYNEDEVIELYESIYDQEAAYANITESDKKYEEHMKLAREYASLADKLQDLVDGK